jgi:hypothetical protein
MPTPLIQSGLPSVPAGHQDKEHKLLLPIYLALNSLARVLSNVTGMNSYTPDEMAQINPVSALSTQHHTRIFLKATVDFPFGKLANIVLDGTSMAARFADATDDTKPAQAICNQPEGIPLGGFGEFLLYTGYTVGISGTAIGSTYYLGTNGDAQLARPAAAGSIIQAVGIGFGSLGFYLQISSLFLKN